jgi:hypothetical protein
MGLVQGSIFFIDVNVKEEAQFSKKIKCERVALSVSVTEEVHPQISNSN